MMITDKPGLYIHIPYCVRKCNYCDFCSRGIGYSFVPDAYIERLISELRAYDHLDVPPISTVYIGGGTPSLLSDSQLSEIISSVKSVFAFDEDVEFTIEANPGTLSREKLSKFRELGVNRLSLGVQSQNSAELSALGRIHTPEDFLTAFRNARAAGFDNISVDLMYGIPHMTRESLRKTLNEVLELSPEHISLYGLIIEEGTPFFDMKDTLPIPDTDEECDMYYDSAELLSRHGYGHYEISNYAKPGYESRHNLKYWRLSEYIGIGASAASFFGGRRYVNTSNIDEYISSSGLKYETEEILTPSDLEYEYVMLGLRLREGISLEDYCERFGKDFTDGRLETLRHLSSASLSVLADDRFFLTERGFYVSNSVLAEIL